MREIIVLSRADAQRFLSSEPWAAIQITGPGLDWPPLDPRQRVGVLQLRFPDLHSPNSLCREEDLFSDDQADQIVAFVREHLDRIAQLLVHCEHGKSRSPAVAAALLRVFLPEADWYQHFATRAPNILVYARVLGAAQRLGLYTPPA